MAVLKGKGGATHYSQGVPNKVAGECILTVFGSLKSLIHLTCVPLECAIEQQHLKW